MFYLTEHKFKSCIERLGGSFLSCLTYICLVTFRISTLLIIILFPVDQAGSCYGDMQCVLISDCPEAINRLKKGQAHGHARCGWEGITEMVCCKIPKTKLPTRNSIAGNIFFCHLYFFIAWNIFLPFWTAQLNDCQWFNILSGTLVKICV